MATKLEQLALKHGITEYAIWLDALDKHGYRPCEAAASIGMNFPAVESRMRRTGTKMLRHGAHGRARVAAALARMPVEQWALEQIKEWGGLRKAAMQWGLNNATFAALLGEEVKGSTLRYWRFEDVRALFTQREALALFGFSGYAQRVLTETTREAPEHWFAKHIAELGVFGARVPVTCMRLEEFRELRVAARVICCDGANYVR